MSDRPPALGHSLVFAHEGIIIFGFVRAHEGLVMLELNQLAELLVRRAAANSALGLGAWSIGQTVLAIRVMLCHNHIIFLVKKPGFMAWRAKPGFFSVLRLWCDEFFVRRHHDVLAASDPYGLQISGFYQLVRFAAPPGRIFPLIPGN
jgi:hypothetical protein